MKHKHVIHGEEQDLENAKVLLPIPCESDDLNFYNKENIFESVYFLFSLYYVTISFEIINQDYF